MILKGYHLSAKLVHNRLLQLQLASNVVQTVGLLHKLYLEKHDLLQGHLEVGDSDLLIAENDRFKKLEVDVTSIFETNCSRFGSSSQYEFAKFGHTSTFGKLFNDRLRNGINLIQHWICYLRRLLNKLAHLAN